MADRSEYTVVIGGVPHTFLLTDQEAERVGATPKAKHAEPKNKARKPANKSAPASDDKE